MIDGLKQIELKLVAQSEGVELRRSGARYVGLCPLHSEKTSSFFVFSNDRFKCFGCGESGDSIDLVRKIHGLDFKGALEHLGINQWPLTADEKRRIRERKRRTELIQRFRKWEVRYSGYLGHMIIESEKLIRGIMIEDLELYAPLLHELPVWEYHLEILINGIDELKYELYKEATKWKKKPSI